MKSLCRTLLLPAIAVVLSLAMQAQTFTVLHSFIGGTDGGVPAASLTLDHAGNLYGTTSSTVFKLMNRPAGWRLATLYSFAAGAGPGGGVLFGPDGSLYGNTSAGGNPTCTGGCGTVYNLKPPPGVCNSTSCPWRETTLYQFTGEQDGGSPHGNLFFDAAGNIYGTALTEHVLYGLIPMTQGWMYHFLSGTPGASYAGVVSDPSGNLFGTTVDGGDGLCYRGVSCGTVFEVSPVGSSWHINILYSFQGNDDGGFPMGALIFDPLGNLYGANSEGVVYRLARSGSNWTFTSLYRVPGPCYLPPGSACGPWSALAIDPNGALYGTSYSFGAYGYGTVFKLTPSDGGWIYTDLHDFTNGSDGGYPMAGVTIDGNGNIFGTTAYGGSSGFGVIFEITQ